MKFTVSSSELVARLQTMSKVIDEKVSLPILYNILFSVRGNSLILTAANSESRMTSMLEIQNEEGQDGEVCIPGGKLTEYIKHLPEQPITFSINMETFALELNCLTASSKQACSSAIEYPIEQSVDYGNNTFSITEEALLSGLNASIYATANDNLRPVMNGILFDIEPDGKLSFVATDSHKMARYMRTDVQTGDLQSNFVLNKKPANVLRGLLSKSDSPVKVSFNDKTVVFETLTYHYTSRLTEGSYPPYKSVIPTGNDLRLVVNRQDLIGALTRVGIFVDATHLVRCELYSNSARLESQDLDFSCSAQETIPCEYNGSEMTIGFSGRYLTESLNNIDSQDVVIEISDPNKPTIIRPTIQNEATDNLVVILPMRI